MVTSIPFFFAMIWMFVFQRDFMSQFFEKSLQVYYLFDYAQMFALNLAIMQPFSNFPTALWVCQIWTSFPELAQVNKRLSILSCKDATLQVLMSVCLSESKVEIQGYLRLPKVTQVCK